MDHLGFDTYMFPLVPAKRKREPSSETLIRSTRQPGLNESYTAAFPDILADAVRAFKEKIAETGGVRRRKHIP